MYAWQGPPGAFGALRGPFAINKIPPAAVFSGCKQVLLVHLLHPLRAQCARTCQFWKYFVNVLVLALETFVLNCQ